MKKTILLVFIFFLSAFAVFAGPYSSVSGRIEELRSSSTALNPCPLIFPLLDGNNSLNPIGSYISLIAMVKASNAPDAALSLPAAGYLFDNIRLFDPRRFPIQETYKRELPIRFRTRDYAEGSWSKSGNGYRIKIRFYGTKGGKTYTGDFKQGALHNVPDWIAACAWEWLEIKPGKKQADYLAAPVFTNEGAFIKAARTEYILRRAPELAAGMEKMAAENPGNPFIESRYLWVLKARKDPAYGTLMENVISTQKGNPMFRDDIIRYLSDSGRYEEAAMFVLNALMKDDNNPALYNRALDVLKKWKYGEGARDLAGVWCEKHADNQDAWIALSAAYNDWAWELRGTGYASTIPKDALGEINKRINEGAKAAALAVKRAPQDGWAWNNLLITFVGMEIKKPEMTKIFQKSISLNPYDPAAYIDMNIYLQPKWHGSEGEVRDFYMKYRDACPRLIYEIARDEFCQCREKGSNPKEKRDSYANVIRGSKYLDEYKNTMPVYLQSNPLDMEAWAAYFHAMSIIGLRKEAIEKAGKIIPADSPNLDALYPTLVLLALRDDKSGQATESDKEAFEKDSENAALKTGMLDRLLKAGGNNIAAGDEYTQISPQNRTAGPKAPGSKAGQNGGNMSKPNKTIQPASSQPKPVPTFGFTKSMR